MDFYKKNILITGASSGIGMQLAADLSRYECKLFLTARRENMLLELKEKLRNNAAEIFIYKNDVSDKSDVGRVYSEIISAHSQIDIAVLNAGVNSKQHEGRFSSEDALKTYGANLFGIIYWAEVIISSMKLRGGYIVGVTSLADARGFSKNAFYSSSKAAASVLLESMRVDLQKDNIKVITVKPGFVKTPMTDANNFHMPLLMDVKKASKIIIEGLKKDKRVIRFPLPTAAGSMLLKAVPNFIYDRLAVKMRDTGERLKKKG